MSTLLLRLAGPMQSWGVGSKFEIRRTEIAPSKSAVLGLLESALGRQRGDALDDLNTLRFGTRIDLPGEIQYDYQTVKTNKASYISKRYYISDGIFLVGLETDDYRFLEEIEAALKKPAFHLFMGRKSYLPTQPFVLGIRSMSLEEALRIEPWLVPKWRQKEVSSVVRILMDCSAYDKVTAIQKDVPTSFRSEKREYKNRGVMQIYVNMHKDMDEEHDPMAELEEEYVSNESST